MVRESPPVESSPDRALELEREYRWSEAASHFRATLSSVPEKDVVGRGKMQEELAYAMLKEAFQSASNEEFKDRMKKVVPEFQKAKDLFSLAENREVSWLLSRCGAMIEYAEYWLCVEASQKKILARASWKSAADSLSKTMKPEYGIEFAKTYNRLVVAAALAIAYESDSENRASIAGQAVEFGEYAVREFSAEVDVRELAMLYSNTSACMSVYAFLGKPDCHARYSDSSREFWSKGVRLSEEDAFIASTLYQMFSNTSRPGWQGDETDLAERALEFCKKTNDRLLIGCALDFISAIASWFAFGTENPDVRDRFRETLVKASRQAFSQFAVVSYISNDWWYLSWSEIPDYAPCVISYSFETDQSTKRDLAERCMRLTSDALERAKRSGYPDIVGWAHYHVGRSLATTASTQTDPATRTRLIEQAIEHKTASIKVLTESNPNAFFLWGAEIAELADHKHELALLTSDNSTRSDMLRDAVAQLKEGLDLTEKSLFLHGDSTRCQIIGAYHSNLGDMLVELNRYANEKGILIEAAKAFENSVKWHEKAGWPSRMAESHWEAAQTYGLLGEHTKASEKFLLASDCYKKAAENVPQLRGFYTEHSSYLRAWSEIEKARYHHARQDPASSKECYNKAAELHESTGKWSFLSKNYFAWAQVENAEDLSQKERSKESADAFREASRLFKDSKSKMQKQLADIEINDERQMVEKLIAAADDRQEFCKARIALEEARLLDKEGNAGIASEKYGLAVDILTETRRRIVVEEDRREIELIITLSKAWMAMAKAEAELSPELYEEAAHLFNDAQNLSVGDKPKNLAMGHSRFCKALQAGARFSDTGDLAQHDVATDNLESAAKFYLKAGFESAAEYARASSLLFDAYVLMSKARKEEDPEKKAKFYSMAEKVLRASGSSYEKAGQPGRKEQVVKLLAKVGEDRELAMSLAEVFLAPDIVSTTMAFSSPTPTHEAAVGLDRFEHADVQAALTVSPKELHVGQELSLEIELVNAGRGAAQLTKVEQVIPEGFDVIKKPENYRIEDSVLNLRGRRLDALKTEDLKLVLKPTVKGHFALRPRIMYLDESSKHKSFETEPVTVTVKELGLSGWLRGT